MKTSRFLFLPRLAAAMLLISSPGVGSIARAQTGPIDQAIRQLLNTLQFQGGASNQELPRLTYGGDGRVVFLGAPPLGYFQPATTDPAHPEVTAVNFLRQHGMAFGITNTAVDFTLSKLISANGRIYLRFGQTYSGLPLIAAEITVQMNGSQGVECVAGHIERDTGPLDNHAVRLDPAVTAGQAAEQARAYFATNGFPEPLDITEQSLAIFAPSVLDFADEIQLVWRMKVSSGDPPVLSENVLVNAQTGAVVHRFTLIYSALNREIHDANCQNNDGMTVRTEGQPLSGIAEADAVYDYYGDTYNFYLNQHGRDSIDGSGMKLVGIVRYTQMPNANCPPPPGLAYWQGGNMHFGRGWAADDVTAHELTHGVTEKTSGLNYENDAGAINEAFSDIWGEFVDLGNGRGNDSPNVRWLMGEDVSVVRNMRDPPNIPGSPNRHHPDRLGSTYYVFPTSSPNPANDSGGVHANSGIINKLCYLLTDGDTFNGQTIQGMGIPQVANLFYEVNSKLLKSAANYHDLFDALRQAGINLGWTQDERRNLFRACVAVEIGGVYVDKANGCPSPSGIRRCRLSGGGPFTRAVDGYNSTVAGENLFIRTGSYNEQFTLNKPMEIRSYDGPATIGQ